MESEINEEFFAWALIKGLSQTTDEMIHCPLQFFDNYLCNKRHQNYVDVRLFLLNRFLESLNLKKLGLGVCHKKRTKADTKTGKLERFRSNKRAGCHAKNATTMI